VRKEEIQTANKRLGKWFRRCRKQLGLDQKDVADQIGCDVSDYGKYETGQHSPRLVRAMEICRILGRDFSSHLGKKD
jgi:transcriptional regulator with XRE-family HTH domain